ncbi:MAG: cellulase family glycosylhydrolase, partial [Prosthecobacter sp.]|nr:cellulase family glycosylhydrolase [Prosthecobacter sp.]
HSTTDTAYNANWGEEDYMIAEFNKMKVKFADQGIPVVLGEFGAIRRTALTAPHDLQLHLNSRAYFHHFASRQAVAHGMVPVYWDNGYTGNNGFAVFDRANYTVVDQQTINALVRGANGLPL